MIANSAIDNLLISHEDLSKIIRFPVAKYSNIVYYKALFKPVVDKRKLLSNPVNPVNPVYKKPCSGHD
jgi:hypothetical protein